MDGVLNVIGGREVPARSGATLPNWEPATGAPLDIANRIGGSVQVLGTPNHPVILTSLNDTTVGAGVTPSGRPQADTSNSTQVVVPSSASGGSFESLRRSLGWNPVPPVPLTGWRFALF